MDLIIRGGTMSDKSFLSRRIKHAQKRVDCIKESHGDEPNKTHTYHGGWSLGYWVGMLTAYQNVLDKEEDTKQ